MTQNKKAPPTKTVQRRLREYAAVAARRSPARKIIIRDLGEFEKTAKKFEAQAKASEKSRGPTAAEEYRKMAKLCRANADKLRAIMRGQQ